MRTLPDPNGRVRVLSMPMSKWVMLCPMARSGSSHTSELLDGHEGLRSHHGLFNEGPFGRWPANKFLAPELEEYYSSILDDRYRRVGGQERSGEFLDECIFTDDPRYNPRQWQCVGFKIQFVHFVHMPDLRDYLIANKDIKIIVNTRRHLLEHACAEFWCQNGNSRGGREGDEYEFGRTAPIVVELHDILATFRNLCRYRQYAIETFDDGERDFLEWSYEDMFTADGSLDVANHLRLFEFLETKPSRPLVPTFVPTPRPPPSRYFANYSEVEQFMRKADGGIFAKYFHPHYDPRLDRSWPKLRNYQLDKIMVEKDNKRFRVAAPAA
jgi:hypothetical protein